MNYRWQADTITIDRLLEISCRLYHEPADWDLAAGAALILAANLVNVFEKAPEPKRGPAG